MNIVLLYMVLLYMDKAFLFLGWLWCLVDRLLLLIEHQQLRRVKFLRDDCEN